ncbi:hypothetical protein AOLI_G00059790 [Acnodon oligacanthus]
MATHEFFVDMTCEGCSGAVTRVLKKIDVKFDIDLPNKKVFIERDRKPTDLSVLKTTEIMAFCEIVHFKNEGVTLGTSGRSVLNLSSCVP